LVLYFHQFAFAGSLVIMALCALTYIASVWWRDVNREGVFGFHTRKVKNGLHLGMLLFIWSERMFFVGLLWAFLHRSLMPTIQIGMSWPPVGIVPVEWTGLPKTNTL
jgi:heme/copper-type cytochrome/quinol oxidase subunit 3